jgi:5-deoxy-glucuronate isomerase
LRCSASDTDDRSLDETLSFGDRDVVLVPKGYHPVGAPHGASICGT